MKNFSKRRIKENIAGHLFIMPVLLGILLFTVLPIAYALLCSFYDFQEAPQFTFFNLGEFGKFYGFGNYMDIFRKSSYLKNFGDAMGTTALYAVIEIPLMLVCSFALAVLLNQKMKGMRFYRTLLYLPVLLPAVCSGIVWYRMTSEFGVINNMLNKIGLPSFTWFESPKTRMMSFIFVSMFGVGGNMILWLAQLKNVPQSVYESARLDGASKARQLFRITIPLCTPMILYNTIISIIGTFQTYVQVQTVMQDIPDFDHKLYFIVHNIYENRTTHFGYACALSFVLFLIIAALTLVTMRTSKWVYYGEEG